jgi:predicted flap endonuclease-1-like 5' DNA nuclease
MVAEEPETSVVLPEEKETAVTVTDTPSASEPTQPDDLKIVEGIGPKIEGILHESGITTFAQLATAEISHLEKIVKEDAGIRIAFPETWPEQAKLAAAGLWDALEKFQAELKGGRQV